MTQKQIRLHHIEQRLANVEKRMTLTNKLLGSLVNKKHSFAVRAAIGVVWMVVGVVIAKFFGHSDVVAVAHLGDLVGFALHGIGLVPFVEKVMEAAS